MPERSSPLIESVRIVLPLLILALAGGGYFVLAKQKQPLEREEPKDTSPLVETVAIESYERGLEIEVDGLAVPYREIRLSAEVDGRVTRKAEICRAGRYVNKGDLLLEIDSRDYDLEIRRLQTEFAQAGNSIKELKVEIANTESLIKLAQEELEIQHEEYQRLEGLLEDSVVTESNLDQVRRAELVAQTAVLGLRNQLRLKNVSQERFDSAKERAAIMLEKAELDSSRTKITSPVSGVVVADSVEEDSYLKKGTELVTIEDTSAVEVKCNLRADQLAWLRRPMSGPISGQEQDDPAGDYGIRQTPVTVVYRFGDQDCEWAGSLCRYDGIGLDETTRTVPCRVVVANPTDGRSSGPETTDGRPPALVRGMFVTVRIHVGRQVDLLWIPSAAVRPGGRLWIVENGRMKLVPVSVASILADRVLIRGGDPHPQSGDKVIVSPLPLAASGMAVREVPK